ncbi:hypothetical protein lhe_1889 [Lactobacillus helveticus CNRZ32]|nr:hypothetical protein lhe_1889 [Lactobacillus helveticus CNRZ32]
MAKNKKNLIMKLKKAIIGISLATVFFTQWLQSKRKEG